MDVGWWVNVVKNAGGIVGGLLGVQYWLVNKLIYFKVKFVLGLGFVRVCVIGVVFIVREILEFFVGLDVVILEVYG